MDSVPRRGEGEDPGDELGRRLRGKTASSRWSGDHSRGERMKGRQLDVTETTVTCRGSAGAMMPPASSKARGEQSAGRSSVRLGCRGHATEGDFWEVDDFHNLVEAQEISLRITPGEEICSGLRLPSYRPSRSTSPASSRLRLSPRSSCSSRVFSLQNRSELMTPCSIIHGRHHQFPASPIH